MPPQETPPEAGSAEEPAETFGETDEKFLKEWAEKENDRCPGTSIPRGKPWHRRRIEVAHRGTTGAAYRSHLVDQVVPIGRRILEVAINEAVSQKELHPRQSEWLQRGVDDGQGPEVGHKP